MRHAAVRGSSHRADREPVPAAQAGHSGGANSAEYIVDVLPDMLHDLLEDELAALRVLARAGLAPRLLAIPIEV